MIATLYDEFDALIDKCIQQNVHETAEKLRALRDNLPDSEIQTIESCYQYQLIAPRMGWDNGHLGSMLRNTKVDVNDMAIVFYSKLARWSDEKLFDKIDDAFREWLQGLKNEAKEMYDDLDAQGKKDVKQIAEQLAKKRDEE